MIILKLNQYISLNNWTISLNLFQIILVWNKDLSANWTGELHSNPFFQAAGMENMLFIASELYYGVSFYFLIFLFTNEVSQAYWALFTFKFKLIAKLFNILFQFIPNFRSYINQTLSTRAVLSLLFFLLGMVDLVMFNNWVLNSAGHYLVHSYYLKHYKGVHILLKYYTAIKHIFKWNYIIHTSSVWVWPF